MAAKPRVFPLLLPAVVAAVLLASAPAPATPDAPDGPALDEKDCRSLVALYRALRGEGVEPDEAPVAAVGNAILDRPGCGETRGALQEARRGSGVNPWDERSPGGFGASGTEQ